MDIIMNGLVAGIGPKNLAEGNLENLQLTPNGLLVIAKGLPDEIELVRSGAVFYGIQNTGVVALNDVAPTTVAASSLWNGEAPGGKSLILTHCFATCTTSAGAASQFQLWGESSILPSATLLTTTDNGNIRSLISGKVYGGLAQISKTVTVSDNGWFPVGPVVQTVLTATVGYTIGGKLPEPVILAPGHYYSVGIAAVNATAAFKCGYIWSEVQLPIAS